MGMAHMAVVYGKAMRQSHGFSMIEFLAAAAIVVFLALLAFQAYPEQIAKARDGQRKDHLARLKVAFEDYYNDHNCYLTQAEYEAIDCGDKFTPYLSFMFCDPLTNEKYRYADDGNACPQWFKAFTNLEDSSDEDIAELGCSYLCGPSTSELEYNYGVSSENAKVDEYAGTAPPPEEWVAGECDGACIPNVCSTCCPGVDYRCDDTGLWCFVDPTCI